MDYKAQLIQLLGLAADATDEQIQAAATTFQSDMVGYKEGADAEIANSKAACEKKDAELAEKEAALANRAKEVETLTAEKASLTEKLVNRDMEIHADVISDKEAIKTALLTNRDSGLAMLNGLKKPVVEPSKLPTHIANREVAAPGTGEVATDDAVRAKRISNRARELKATLNVPFSTAFTMAKNENPVTA